MMSGLNPTDDDSPASRAAMWFALAFALTGLAISAWLTIEHFNAAVPLSCPHTTSIDCVKVTTSPWSVLLGIPVAVLGLGFFVVITPLLLPFSWELRRLDGVRIFGSAVGTTAVLYLVWIELFRVDAICLWCTGVHICTVGMLLAVLWHTVTTRTPASTR